MSKGTVLVPQPFGRAGRRFIQALRKRGVEVILLAPSAQLGKIAPEGTLLTDFVDYAKPAEVLDAASRLVAEAKEKGHPIVRVGVTWEFSVEVAAAIREHLRLPGLRSAHARLFRDKRAMSDFLANEGIRVPRFKAWNGSLGQADSDIQAVAKSMSFPLILKPPNGTANIGVKKVGSLAELPDVLTRVREETKSCPFQELGYAPSDEWMLTEFVDGREFEVDVFVRDGEVRFAGIQEKTILREEGPDLVEVRTVTPPLSVTGDEMDMVRTFLGRLAGRVAAATGERSFQIYPEFRIHNGECVCLEVAFRIGGTCFALERAYEQLDMFDLAAAAVLDEDPGPLPARPTRAVSCQTIYSRHPGIFLGVHGLKHLTDTEFEELAKPYSPIVSPHSEYIANVYAWADTPQNSEALLNKAIADTMVATIVHSPQPTTASHTKPAET